MSLDERQPLSLDISLIRRLGLTQPEALPHIFVHDNAVWKAKGGVIAAAKIDHKGNLHMAEVDFVVLKTMLPVKEIGRLRKDLIEFAFDLQPHHMAGGFGDKKPLLLGADAKPLLREGVGQDPFGRKPKPKLAGLH